VKLAQETYKSIKSVNPKAKVLVGGLGDDLPDWPWLKQAILFGLLDYADGISVHLYNHCDKKNVGADELMTRLDQLRELMVISGKSDLPIYVTEVGWPTDVGKCGLSETRSALHTLRFLLEASTKPWIGGVWFYEFMDGGDNPQEREHRFGLLRRDGSEKPSGCIVRELSKVVSTRPRQLIKEKEFSYAVYNGDANDLLIIWSTSENILSVRELKLLVEKGEILSKQPELCNTTTGEMVMLANEGGRIFIHGLAPIILNVSNDFYLK